MANTKYYNLERQEHSSEIGASYVVEIYENPVQYEESITTIADWDKVGVSVRQSNNRLCQGVINQEFFSGKTTSEASVIFMLYYLSTGRNMRLTKTLLGFALTTDLRIDHESDEDDDDDDHDTLYIDAICTNTDIRHIPTVGIRGVGTILMNTVEEYAIKNDFTNIKLSALPYVIGYYRRLGYRHVNRCEDLKITRHGMLEEKDTDIAKASNNVNMRFRNDEQLDYALKIELAKMNIMLAPDVPIGHREQMEYLVSNLNSYFKTDGIGFIIDNINQETKIVAIDVTGVRNGVDRATLDYITNLISEDNFPLLHLINILRLKGFSVGCSESEVQQGESMRHITRRDSDGDIVFNCLDEGFTMRKCLIPYTSSGGGQKKMKRSGTKQQKKSVPWAGWSKISPSAREKTIMKHKCGNKCFLGPNKSFPVCVKKTCRVSKKGAWAAFIRARAWGNKRKTYRTKTKPRYQRKTYKKVERKAKQIINK